MYIQSISNTNNIAMQGRWSGIKQKLFDKLPNVTFKNPSEKLEKATDIITRPGPNRAIMGATAIVIQPAIDASNKKIDKKTRDLSVCRTIAKIFVGTAVGILVRHKAYKFVEKRTLLNDISKSSKSLLPKLIPDFMKSEMGLKKYRNLVATALGLCALFFTNFLVDAPLTTILTNLMQKKFLEKEPANAPKENIKEGIYV